MNIYVVGSGKLATAILTASIEISDSPIRAWKGTPNTLEKSVLIHAGSGRQLQECRNFCQKTQSIFIELATGLETAFWEVDFPMIICPNTSILLLKTLHMLKENGWKFANCDIELTESHQSSKSTEPGTAYKIADYVGVPHTKIVSIRDTKIQEEELRIPKAYLHKHAYHKLTIKDGSDEITLSIKVLGHDSYVSGVKKIVQACLAADSLENRSYDVLELADMGLL
ncbi:hypothetical protein [Sphingobacterium sp. LRF_L2]|uniref:hypothetical protein n=1 Tax=Sphingobacterium sp. LRF_L2 TaxID=3369421 RepID=UPI003F5E8617